jgi:hypothetical protein
MTQNRKRGRRRLAAGPAPRKSATGAADPSVPDPPDGARPDEDEGPGSRPDELARAAERDAGPGGSLPEQEQTATEDVGPGGPRQHRPSPAE